MWIRTRREVDAEFLRDLERGMLRSAFVSTFWAVITSRKKEAGFTMTGLAQKLGVHKSAVSRWFSSEPNWEVNTIADIADALDVELRIEAIDRRTGRRFGPSGPIYGAITSTNMIPGANRGSDTRTNAQPIPTVAAAA